MARIRTIKPSFFTSLTIATLPLSARLTFIGLWTYSDDEGRARDDTRLIKAAIWPLDDGHGLKKIDADLVTLEKAHLIERYLFDGQRYLHICSWSEHQRINRPTPSVHPPSPETSLNPQGADMEDSSPEGKGMEGNQDQGTEAAGPPREPAAPAETGTAHRTSPWSDDPLVARFCDEVSHNHRSTHRAKTWRVISHLRAHVDEVVIDETIGRLAQLDTQVSSPNFLLTTVRSWAAERDITIPAMERG